MEVRKHNPEFERPKFAGKSSMYSCRNQERNKQPHIWGTGHPGSASFPLSHKPALLNGRFGNCKVGGCKETLCQLFANLVPTLHQPFANLFCQPLCKLLFLRAPIARLETRVNGFRLSGSKASVRHGRKAADIHDPRNVAKERRSEKLRADRICPSSGNGNLHSNSSSEAGF